MLGYRYSADYDRKEIMRRRVFTIFQLLLINLLFCQSNFVDSLNKVLLKTTINDTTRYNSLIYLGNFYQTSDVDSAIYFHKKAILVAKKMKDELNEGEAIRQLGWDNYIFGDNSQSLNLIAQAKSIADRFISKAKPGDKNSEAVKLRASCCVNFGLILAEQGNHSLALQNYFTALKDFEQIKFVKGQSVTLGNIAIVYDNQHDSKKALEYYLKALDLDTKLKNEFGVIRHLGNIGGLYHNQKNYDKATEYYLAALNKSKALGNREGEAVNLANLGLATMEKLDSQNADISNKDYKKAIDYFEQAETIHVEIGDGQSAAINLGNIGLLYIRLKNYKLAEQYIQKAYGLGKEANSFDILQFAHKCYNSLYEATGNHQLALEHFKLYIQYKDSIFNEENTRATIQQEYKFDYEKKAAADSVKLADEKMIIAVQLKQERTQKIALYGGLAIVIVFSLFIFNRFRITNKQKKIIELKEIETQKQNVIISRQKHLVEEKHKEITDSINYAERIQRSFLATKELLDENLGEYFILFKPKDVVSGDFYWAAKLHNDKFALVTADSTGHGVPGAIMSLLNITSLEKAIESYIRPADILNSTRKTIIERLKKDGSAEGGKDGMDASLCVFDFKNKKLSVSAANNPVWIMRIVSSSAVENQYEVLEIKPDKMPVGKHDKQDISFSQQEIELQSGDVIYALTDGFPDQFGGPIGKKFMSKKLRELLAANAHLSMAEQKQLLEQTFTEWVGNVEQVDDVTLIGVRV